MRVLAILNKKRELMSGSFIQELKRRNVFRVAVIYLVVSWLLMQIGDVMFPALLLPEWTTTLLVAFLLLGFPVAMLFAWAFELTPDGVVRTADVPKEHSITANTGQRINYFIIGALAIAVVFLLGRSWLAEDVAPKTQIEVMGKSIAVLPFKNQSASVENAEFFAGGLHDELLTLLSKIGELKVISRTSVERLDPGLSIPEIGALLGVATVLEGQVQRAGDRLRINVQLIDTAHEGHLWANTYDRALTAENVFDVQSDIARTISNSLHAELSTSDEELLGNVPTAVTEALEQYLLGKQLWNQATWKSLWSASDHFKAATSLDPNYAHAWAALAGVASNLFQTGAVELQDYVSIAKPAIDRALAIDGNLSEAHAELAAVLWQSGDLAAAEVAYKKALALNPRSSITLYSYGNYLRTTNRPREAIPVLERALENDPLSSSIMFDIGKAEMYLGNSNKNLLYAARIIETDPDSVYGIQTYLQSYLALGHIDLAWPWCVRLMASDPDDYEMLSFVMMASAQLGEFAWAERYKELAFRTGAEKPAVLKYFVQTLDFQGRFDEATDVAQHALEANLESRWFSDRIFLRQIRDNAFKNGDLEGALAWYRDRTPELFGDNPQFSIDNINSAADLALLLRKLGQEREAESLTQAGLNWYQPNRPTGGRNYETGIVDVDFLALSGQTRAALDALRETLDYGWVFAWQWYIHSPNLDSIRDETEFQDMVAELQNKMATQLVAVRALPDMGEFDLRN